jgi:hypothetical protein
MTHHTQSIILLLKMIKIDRKVHTGIINSNVSSYLRGNRIHAAV